MDESATPGNRKSRRSNVLLAATIESGGTSIPVKLRNLSEQGALIEGPSLPIEGAEILFRRNDLAVRGRVAWVSGKQAGISFVEPLSPQDVLRNVPQPRPRVQSEFKRPGLNPRSLSVQEQVSMEHWLEMLAKRP